MHSLSFSLFLRLMVSGSAALPEPVMKEWQDITGEISTLHVQRSHMMRFRLLCIGVIRCPLMLRGPVVQNPINDNPRLKVNQGVYFSIPRCCSTLIFCKTLHQKKSILKSKNKQKKLSPKS